MGSDSLDIYAEWSEEVAIYLAAIEKFVKQEKEQQTEFLQLLYNAAALCGEAGEILNILMQAFRNESGKLTPAENDYLKEEAGDCLFYLVRFILDLGYDPVEVMQENMLKLNTRKKRGKLAHRTVETEKQQTLPGFDVD